MKIDTSKLQKRLNGATKNIPDNVRQARREAAEDLLSKALPRTPMGPTPDGGNLRETGDVDHSGDVSIVSFGGGATSEYALVMHEGGWNNYMGTGGPKSIENWTTPGSGSKFLESPFLENKERYKRHIRDAVRRGLERR